MECLDLLGLRYLRPLPLPPADHQPLLERLAVELDIRSLRGVEDKVLEAEWQLITAETGGLHDLLGSQGAQAGHELSLSDEENIFEAVERHALQAEEQLEQTRGEADVLLDFFGNFLQVNLAEE